MKGLRADLVRGALIALALLPAAAPHPLAAAEWPQFRGLLRDGISPEAGLAAAWPAGGPPQVWRREIGEGLAGIAIAGGRLFTLQVEPGTPQDQEAAVAFSLDGKRLWSAPLGPVLKTEYGNGPRATPTVAGDRVLAIGSYGLLACLSAATGERLWEVDLPGRFGAALPRFGYTGSPLVHGGLVIVNSAGSSEYAAFDLASGQLRWTAGPAQPEPSYASPLLFRAAGRDQIAYFTARELRAIDPAGRQLWSHPWPKGETHAMPLFLPPDRLYVSGAIDIGAHLLKIGPDAAKIEELAANPEMRNHFSSAVAVGAAIYGFDNGTLKCIDRETLAAKWAKRGFGKGSLIAFGDFLIVLGDRGQLALVRATAESYQELGRAQAFESTSWTPPALADGRLYLRNHQELVVYDLTARTGL